MNSINSSMLQDCSVRSSPVLLLCFTVSVKLRACSLVLGSCLEVSEGLKAQDLVGTAVGLGFRGDYHKNHDLGTFSTRSLDMSHRVAVATAS